MLPVEIFAQVIGHMRDQRINTREVMSSSSTLRKETLRILLRDLQFDQYSERRLNRLLENINEFMALFIRSIRIDSLDISQKELKKLTAMAQYLQSLCMEDVGCVSGQDLHSIFKRQHLNSFSLVEMNPRICSDQLLSNIETNVAGKRLQEFRFGVRRIPRTNDISTENEFHTHENILNLLPESFTDMMDHLHEGVDSNSLPVTEQASDTIVGIIRKSPNLQKIEICGIPLKLNVLKELKRLQYLKHLCLSHVRLVDDVCEYLPLLLSISCQKLEFILSDPPLPPICHQKIADTTVSAKLREIDLSFSRIDNETVSLILDNSQLTRLHLLSCHNIAGDELLGKHGKLINFYSGKSFSINRDS